MHDNSAVYYIDERSAGKECQKVGYDADLYWDADCFFAELCEPPTGHLTPPATGTTNGDEAKI
ncbi:hypothetical protein ACC695_39710, partial [Rhizobium ruizarguesonis]